MNTWCIKMLGTYRGSNTGHDMRQYKQDEILIVGKDIGDSLARSFIAQGRATEVEDAVSK